MIKEINLPDIGTSNTVEVIEILVKINDQVKTEQSLITVEDDKTSIEIPSPYTGTVKEIKVSIGDKLNTGSLIILLNTENNTYSEKKISDFEEKKTKNNLKNTMQLNEKNDIHASPMIRRLAYELEIDLTEIKGSGNKNRILKEDIENYLQNTVKNNTLNPIEPTKYKTNLPNIIPWPKMDFNQFGETEEINLTSIKKISSANLTRNWIMIPHVTLFDKCDITDLQEFIKERNNEIKTKNANIKISLLVFIIKAVANTLKKFPLFNSSLSLDGKKIILKKYINIGVAVETKNGLLVPVLKEIHKKNILDLSNELTKIIEKTHSNTLSTKDMQGGSFTISSLGKLGTIGFTPIIKAPEVAILGISKFSVEPIWNDKEFIPRIILPLSLSFDHRVIDGADGARFIKMICNLLSDIRRFII